jgi:Arc/MetJ-type ribon-helix-helix transcriptional regulator
MADRIQITLDDPAIVEFVRAKVRSGEFASEADAVREMVDAWREEDAEYERWLRVEIAARHDEAVAHPERLIPAEEVMRRLAERRKKREALAS